jgi:hypothetical protein
MKNLDARFQIVGQVKKVKRWLYSSIHNMMEKSNVRPTRQYGMMSSLIKGLNVVHVERQIFT